MVFFGPFVARGGGGPRVVWQKEAEGSGDVRRRLLVVCSGRGLDTSCSAADSLVEVAAAAVRSDDEIAVVSEAADGDVLRRVVDRALKLDAAVGATPIIGSSWTSSASRASSHGCSGDGAGATPSPSLCAAATVRSSCAPPCRPTGR